MNGRYVLVFVATVATALAVGAVSIERAMGMEMVEWSIVSAIDEKKDTRLVARPGFDSLCTNNPRSDCTSTTSNSVEVNRR